MIEKVINIKPQMVASLFQDIDHCNPFRSYKPYLSENKNGIDVKEQKIDAINLFFIF